MPANVYRIIADYGLNDGQPLCADFTAPNSSAATTVAHLILSAMQRSGRLVPVGSSPPYNLVTGATPNVALTSTPSGIGY